MFSPGPKGESSSEGSIYGDTAKTAQPTNVPPETPGFGIMSGIGTLITCFFFTTICQLPRPEGRGLPAIARVTVD